MAQNPLNSVAMYIVWYYN